MEGQKVTKEREVKKRKPTKYQLIVKNKKLCSKCEQWKFLTEYHKDSSKSSGVRSDCKSCCMPIKKKYYCDNRELLNKMAWEKEKNDPLRRERGLERRRIYNNSTKGRLNRKKWKLKNRNKLSKYNKPKSEGQKLLINLRKQLNRVLKRKKLNTSLNYIGCTLEELKIYIESKFTHGMSWENYGRDGWHIDHIRPCASFDLNIEEEVYKCFNFKNLQPLWQAENLSKGSFYNGERYGKSTKK